MTRTLARPVLGTIEARHRPVVGDVEERASPAAAPTLDGPRLRGVIPYGIESRDLGGWTEVIEPGALAHARMDDLVATVDHGGVPIGRHPGTLTVEDGDAGLAWSVALPESRGDVREAVQRGDLAGGSWKMIVGREEMRGNVRHVHEITDLLDVAVVSSPAYRASVVEHRSAPTPPAGPTPGRPPRRGTLRVEDRTADSGLTPRGRVERAILEVEPGEARDLTRATANPVEPDDLRTVLIDRLREAAALPRAGVPVVTTERAIATWPRLTGDVGVDFYDELEEITESDPTFSDFTVAVKKLATLVCVSAEALEDSAPDLGSILTSNIITAMALKADRELISGSDPDGFTGLLGVPGTQTLPVNGALTYDALLMAAAMLAELHVPGPYVALVGSRPALALDLLKEAGTGAFVAAPANVPRLVSTDWLPITGSTPDFATTALVFAPAQSMIVVRRGVAVEVDRSQEFSRDAILFRGRQRLGLGVPRPESIVKLTGVDAPLIGA